MFLNLSWDHPIDSTLGIIAQGKFNLSFCGGPNDWSITQKPALDAYFSCVYSGERYGYVFSFYSDIGKVPMFNIAKSIDGNRYEQDRYIVILTDTKLNNYNHSEECLDGVLTGEIDSDQFGGNILFLNFK